MQNLRLLFSLTLDVQFDRAEALLQTRKFALFNCAADADTTRMQDCDCCQGSDKYTD